MSTEFKYADLLDDDVFKLVFGRDSSKDVMIEFLNQVIPDRKITDLDFMDKEMKTFDRTRKDSLYDMFCRTEDGSRIIVEVQRPRGSLSGFAYPGGISPSLDCLFNLQVSLFFAYTKIKS